MQSSLKQKTFTSNISEVPNCYRKISTFTSTSFYKFFRINKILFDNLVFKIKKYLKLYCCTIYQRSPT